MAKRAILAPAFLVGRKRAREPELGVITLHCVLCAEPGTRRPHLRDAVLCDQCHRHQVVGALGSRIIHDAVRKLFR